MAATMATKITAVLDGDLGGGPADETARSGIGGTDYEIDLSPNNATAFRRQFAPLHRILQQGWRGQRQRPGRTAGSQAWSADIRAWP